MYISSGGSEASEVALQTAMISTGKNEVGRDGHEGADS
jgi:hypothetical protein